MGYPGSYDVNEYIDKKVSKTTCDVLLGESSMTIARYPNSGYLNITSVEGKETASTNSFGIGYDSTLAAHAEKWAAVAEEDTKNQPLMFGYWNNGWATQTVPMVSVDTASKIITSGHPSRFGVSEGKRYYVFNMLEEIDAPGEYFIDRNTGKLYFYKPADVSEDTPIVLTLKKPVFNITSDYTTINGINIGGTSSNGIVVKADNVKIKNCEIRNTSATAISAEGNNILVENCNIHDVNGGISMTGGNLQKLERSGNVVSNCEISNYSKLYRTYANAVNLSGVGNTAINNSIHDSEHIAIGFSGCYNIVKYNEIYNVCTETDDAGAIYVGRTWIDRGNEIVDNYIHDIDSSIENVYGVGAIFLDDHYAGAYIKGNVFEKIEGYAIRGNAGREHTITNNVFVKCNEGVYISNASEDTSIYSSQMSGLEKSYYQTEVWKNAFPELYNIKNNYPYENRDIVLTNNLFVGWDNTYRFGDKVSKYVVNTNNYQSYFDPGFKNMSKRNYTITAETMKKRIPDFETIEFESMGRK